MIKMQMPESSGRKNGWDSLGYTTGPDVKYSQAGHASRAAQIDAAGLLGHSLLMNTYALTESEMDARLLSVAELVADQIRGSSLSAIWDWVQPLVQGGKYLRARLLFRVGSAIERGEDELVHMAASVELLHAASLFHDDVIDGGMVRRSQPAFWTEHGEHGAILVGDLLFFLAVKLLRNSTATSMLIDAAERVCNAEIEQDLIMPGNDSPDWEAYVGLVERKTGSLFAFSAAAPACDDEELKLLLWGAGSRLGAAYQIADDMLDRQQEEQGRAGKTLGRDSDGRKHGLSALEAVSAEQAAGAVQRFLQGSLDELSGRDPLQRAWQSYLDHDLMPVLRHYVDFPAGKS